MRQLLFWLAIAAFGATLPAAAEPLNLANCTNRLITVKISNDDDIFCLAFREKKDVPKCGLTSYACVGKCKVEVEGSPLSFSCVPEPISGDQMYRTDGRYFDTNAMLETYVET